MLEDVKFVQVDLNGGFPSGKPHHWEGHLFARKYRVLQVCLKAKSAVDFEGEQSLGPVQVEFHIALPVPIVIFTERAIFRGKSGENRLQV